MTQPDYVPIATADRVRPVGRLPVPDGWRPDRPADEPAPVPPRGRSFGSTGPDLGYGLKLARRLAGRLQLLQGESVDDAVAGCFAVGAKRAARTGRAPVIYDMEFAYTLWGYLTPAPEDLLGYRYALFKGAAHHYWEQRAIVDLVRDEAYALAPADVAAHLANWRSLLLV